MKDDVIKLFDDKEDNIGKEVFGNIESVSQTEYFQASQSGLKPQYKIVISEYDYENETIARYNSQVFAIYRTFLRNDEHIELYLTLKAGVHHGSG
ncbi:MAG: hypothetical protein K0R50_1241 [Eubacterium sp.]|nr:hypothetical protein [Eubacterium sp.]